MYCRLRRIGGGGGGGTDCFNFFRSCREIVTGVFDLVALNGFSGGDLVTISFFRLARTTDFSFDLEFVEMSLKMREKEREKLTTY